MKEMTVSQLLNRRLDLEKTLLEKINKEIRNFERETGINISRINLNFIDVGTLDKPRAQRLLTNVSVHLDLEEIEERGE